MKYGVSQQLCKFPEVIELAALFVCCSLQYLLQVEWLELVRYPLFCCVSKLFQQNGRKQGLFWAIFLRKWKVFSAQH